jgi:hypothetical protein
MEVPKVPQGSPGGTTMMTCIINIEYLTSALLHPDFMVPNY